jgi:hypothetical protein
VGWRSAICVQKNKYLEFHTVGAAAGGVHVALAGRVTRVIAHSNADIRILPRIAIAQVCAEVAEEKVSAGDWVVSGAVMVFFSESTPFSADKLPQKSLPNNEWPRLGYRAARKVTSEIN